VGGRRSERDDEEGEEKNGAERSHQSR
jgi:hypothetical protein